MANLNVRVNVQSGPHAGTVVTWHKPGVYLIGRSAGAHLPLVYDLAASVEHCRLEITEHACLIEDLGSRQGTLINGSPSTRAFVQSGDTIEVGMSHLLVSITDGSVSEATVLRRKSWSASAATVLGGETAETTRGVLDIPGYTIGRKLGAGAMGVVYEATRQDSGERVAIKTIIPPPGAAQRSILLFRREMELLSQLEHPRIVRYVESGEFAGQIYLVMEYVETIDLEVLSQGLPQSRKMQLLCSVTCQVLEALEFAHQHKLVHRDVKPRNILVSRNGRRVSAKLADFGLAKNFELAGLSQLTADHEIRGTPAFMPWEQLKDSRYAKPTVDIYSTAATLFFYLMGRSPGHTSRKSPPTESFAALPPGLGEILTQALASDPRHRYPTAEAMRQALLPFTRQRAENP